MCCDARASTSRSVRLGAYVHSSPPAVPLVRHQKRRRRPRTYTCTPRFALRIHSNPRLFLFEGSAHRRRRRNGERRAARALRVQVRRLRRTLVTRARMAAVGSSERPQPSRQRARLVRPRVRPPREAHGLGQTPNFAGGRALQVGAASARRRRRAPGRRCRRHLCRPPCRAASARPRAWLRRAMPTVPPDRSSGLARRPSHALAAAPRRLRLLCRRTRATRRTHERASSRARRRLARIARAASGRRSLTPCRR